MPKTYICLLKDILCHCQMQAIKLCTKNGSKHFCCLINRLSYVSINAYNLIQIHAMKHLKEIKHIILKYVSG